MAALLALAATAPPARADVGETIIQRCVHAQSLSGFSQQAYQQALKELSAGTEEYSNCASLIHQAQLAAAAGQGGPSGASSGAAVLTPTPAEQQAIARASHAGSAPVQVGGQTIRPGVVHADIASAFSMLPTPLLATVAFLLVCLLTVAGTAIRKRVRESRSR
ncbi:MAG TPA: hypothetical protein VES65_04175 [Solirubrobacteraceae bacterium]|nr:hypothetical protein [Solirubrobacteraceae bacterium]